MIKSLYFSGISGAGKSTLAAGLMQRGYQLLSDDISVVSLDKHPTPFVYAGYPGMKLWVDSMLKLGFKPENYIRVREKLNKHHLSIGSDFNPAGMPLKGIYMLQTRNSDGIIIEPIKGIEKFNALKNNTYRLNFIKGIGNTESHFRHLSAIATSCDVKRITRSSKGFDLNRLLNKN
ncbi:MAG: hypothetical protein HC905_19915 [Bacteroidales bacterium]|nr:hypothetical protein [Bacteroidales bacterium]